MSLQYGLYQPLRFYENVNHQNRFKNGFVGNIFELITPTNYLIPFQIKRPASSLPINSIKYVSVKTGLETEAIGALGSSDTKLFPFNSYDIFVHFGQEPHTLGLPEGEYHLIVSDTVNTWYSETFFLKNFDPDNLNLVGCELTKITYYDTCDVGGIFYRTLEYHNGLGGKQYKNVFYLDVEIGKPEYEYTEEGEEDGLGNFSPDYKKLTKNYFLQPILPEFMLDAIQLLPLHKNIEVETREGYTGVVDTLTVNSEWEGDKGVWALTDILFSTDFVVKTGCCSSEEVPLTTCLRVESQFVAYLLEGSDDYNNFEYADASDATGTTKIPLVDNDRVLVEDLSGILTLKDYNETNGTYDSPTLILSKGNTFIDANELNGVALNPQLYYLWGGSNSIGFLEDVEITDVTYNSAIQKWTVTGKAFDPSTVVVYGKVGSNYIQATQDTGENFNDNGTLFTMPPTSTHVKIVCVGATGCEAGESVDFELPFGDVGTGVIGSTFIVG